MPVPPWWQRLLALLAYLLPWSDGVMFGRSLFSLYPPLQVLAFPALPVLQVEQLLPFGGLVLFLGLYFGVARNGRVPYLIRFHVMQAILVDIVLWVLALAFQILLRPLGAGFVLRTLENTVFLGLAALVLVAVTEAVRGKESEIPTLSEAVRLQLP